MTRCNFDMRPATKDDIMNFYGEEPFTIPEALVGLLDGKPVVLGGVYHDEGCTIAFSSIKEEVRGMKKDIVKFTYHVMNLISEHKNVIAITDLNIPGSGDFLKALGFKFGFTSEIGDVYTYG